MFLVRYERLKTCKEVEKATGICLNGYRAGQVDVPLGSAGSTTLWCLSLEAGIQKRLIILHVVRPLT